MVYPIIESLALNNVNAVILEAPTTLTQPEKLQHLPTPPDIDLAFHNLIYTVKEGKKGDTKTILKNVSGKFRHNELAAITGPPGAGKSSLLDILSGYKTANIELAISVNGISQNSSNLRNMSAYIMQNHQLDDYLRVEEAMVVSANLKLSETITIAQKNTMIDDILQTVELIENKSILIKNLSSGEKKRLSIALELISNPSVLFIDDPTSGLDSSTGFQFIDLLKKLAGGGRTIICTIRKPTTRISAMLDQIYTLAEGQCIYQGNTKLLVPYLRTLDLECPIYYDPALYIIEYASLEHEEHINKLVKAVDNGARDIRTESDFAYIKARNDLEELKNLNELDKNSDQEPLNELDKNSDQEPQTSSDDNALSIGVENKENETTAPLSEKNTSPEEYPTSQLNQFFVIIKKTMISSFRKRLIYIRLLAHILFGFLVGALYYGIGNDASKAISNLGFLFFNVMFLMYASITVTIITFPLQIPVLLKEKYNRWYSLRSYFLALTLSDIPFQLIFCMIYVTIVYFLTSQPVELFRYSMNLSVCLLTSLVAQSVGLVIGIAMNEQRGLFFAQVISAPLLLFSGFFITFDAIPNYLKWITYFSYTRYGYEGSVIATYGYGRDRLDCSEQYCHYKSPKTILESLGMENSTFSMDIAILVAFFFILRIVAFLFLSRKLKTARIQYKTL